MKKLLSVLFITWDSDDFLKESIQSIYDISDEIIVVDNDSQDNTLEILHSFPQTKMRIVSQKFEGKTYQEIVKQKRNLCLDIANINKPDWLLYIDPDEIYRQKDLQWLEQTIRKTDKVHIRYKSLNFWKNYDTIITGPHWDDSQERCIRNLPGLKYTQHAFSISVGNEVLAKKYGKDFLDGIHWCQDECKIYHYAMLCAEWKIKRKLRNYMLSDNPAVTPETVECFVQAHPFFSGKLNQPRHGPQGLWVAGIDPGQREQLLFWKGQHPETMKKKVEEFHQTGKMFWEEAHGKS